MARNAAALVACLLLSTGLLLSQPKATPSGPIDLTGTWIDPQRGPHNVVQTGNDLTFTNSTGAVFKGTLKGEQVSLTHQLTAKDLVGIDKRVAAYLLEHKVTVSIEAKLTPDRLYIVGHFNDIEAQFAQKGTDFEVTGVKPIARDIQMSRMEYQPKLSWDDPGDVSGHKLEIEGTSKPVVGVRKKDPMPVVKLLIEDRNFDFVGKIESLEIRNLAGSRRGLSFSRNLLHVSFDGTRNHISFDSGRLLDSLKTAVNTNVLDAVVTVRDQPASRAVRAESKNVLHIFVQKLIVFLPGVAGSTIRMSPATGGSPVEVFPVLSRNMVGESPINRLECKKDGSPVRPADELDLFRSYGVGDASSIDVVPILSRALRVPLDTTLVYDVERRPAITEPKDHPNLKVDGKGPIRYYPIKVWPYDWRGRLETTADMLFSSRGEKVDPPYRDPPTIQRLIDAVKKDNPLLDDKVALVGHSTGGLVIRGAIVHAGATSVIDKAFYIDVPFFGAPKSYFVYLAGDMGIPLVATSLMRNLSPNMPIVYYLAPNLGYPDPIYRDKTGFAFDIHFPSLLPKIVKDAQAAGIYPKDKIAEWNEGLQQAAFAYHRSVQTEPAIKWKNNYVFHSSRDAAAGADCSSGMTIGVLKVGAREMECESTAGDYTVPLVSQLGDFAFQADAEKIPIPGAPLHVPSPNVDFVWEEIVKRIQR
jgi:pimeloyl-ACP methyl ester carboxylesterase